MGLRDILAKWLGIVPVEKAIQINIVESTTKELTTLKNQLWYRGDSLELEQFYVNVAGMGVNGKSMIPSTKFWAAMPTYDNLIRKLHSGLPRLIADKLASIVADDMNDPDMSGGELQRWEAIAEESEFEELLKGAITKVLAEGDGAFKICVDPEVSELPLIEFFSGNDVAFEYKRGKLVEILFYTDYFHETKRYRLCEHYGKGYVRYKLYDSLEREIPLETLPELEGLADTTFVGDYIMGVPVKFYNSAKFKNRGESIFEGKGDSFDAFDEIMSTWMDAVRAGRVKQYIPESLVPRNEDTGALMKPSVFNGFVIKNTDLAEEADNKIEVIQGDINYDGLLASYITMLDSCLQGLISPSTLGIDVKKLDNAESQREKEKTTLYTRDTIVGILRKVLPSLVDVVLKTDDNLAGRTPQEKYEATFEWGQYANPAFEALVETIGKAKQYGIMSVDRCVEELYGDSLTEEEKLAEVALIKGETALTLDAPPAVNDEFGGGGGEEEKEKEVAEEGEALGSV